MSVLLLITECETGVTGFGGGRYWVCPLEDSFEGQRGPGTLDIPQKVNLKCTEAGHLLLL